MKHAGTEQSLTLMHQDFHWPGIRADIASHCMHCDACQRQKLIMALPPNMEQPYPLKHVHVHLSEPFPTKTYDVQGRLLPTAPYKSWLVSLHRTLHQNLHPFQTNSLPLLLKQSMTFGFLGTGFLSMSLPIMEQSLPRILLSLQG